MTRLVAVERRLERTLTPAFTGDNSATLPLRARDATLRIRPESNVTVTAVRADARVLLYDPDGIRGRHDVSLPPLRTVTLHFAASDALSPGSVDIVYHPTEVTKRRLAVTVDG